MDEIDRLAEKALDVIPGKVKFYADLIGVTTARLPFVISVRNGGVVHHQESLILTA